MPAMPRAWAAWTTSPSQDRQQESPPRSGRRFFILSNHVFGARCGWQDAADGYATSRLRRSHQAASRRRLRSPLARRLHASRRHPSIIPLSGSNRMPFMPPATRNTELTRCPRDSSSALSCTEVRIARFDLKFWAAIPHPRSFHSFLHRHAVVNDVGDGLYDAAKNTHTARRTEGHVRAGRP